MEEERSKNHDKSQLNEVKFSLWLKEAAWRRTPWEVVFHQSGVFIICLLCLRCNDPGGGRAAVLHPALTVDWDVLMSSVMIIHFLSEVSKGPRIPLVMALGVATLGQSELKLRMSPQNGIHDSSQKTKNGLKASLNVHLYPNKLILVLNLTFPLLYCRWTNYNQVFALHLFL